MSARTASRVSRPRGQVLILVAAGLTVLVAIGALVVDLGLSWMLRRDEQNAADPAAIAAAQYIPSNDTASMRAIACFYARQNGFFPSATTNDLTSSGCVPANDPRSAVLTVNFPPQGSLAGQFSGRAGFVQVVINAQHASFFGRIFGQTTASVVTGAVAAFNTGNSNSNSLIALDPNNDCASGNVQGNNGGQSEKVVIVPATNPATGQPYDGGYVYVNSTCAGVPSPEAVSACGNGSGALQIGGGSGVTAPRIFTVGRCSLNGAGAFVGTSWGTDLVDQGAIPIGDPLAEIEPPHIDISQAGAACTSPGSPTTPVGAQGCTWSGKTTVTLSPGVYYGGWQINSPNTTVKLLPGIYIIAGGGISDTNGSLQDISGNGNPDDARVLIFSTDDPYYAAACKVGTATNPAKQCQGPVKFVGQSNVNLQGLSSGPYAGMTIWQDGRASCGVLACQVNVGGSGSITLAGTIYAPNQQVVLDGGSATGGVAAIQIISWQWKITGGSTLTMPYDPTKLYHLDNKGLVH